MSSPIHMIAFSIHSGWMKDMISMPNVRSASAIARNFARKERVCLSTRKRIMMPLEYRKKRLLQREIWGFSEEKLNFIKIMLKYIKYNLFSYYETRRMTNIQSCC